MAWPRTDSDGVQYWEKNPDDKDSFTIDWSDRIGTDTINVSVWEVPTGITKVSDAVVATNTKTTIVISGGTEGVDYDLTNKVTLTNSALELNKVIRFKVRDKAVKP